MTIDNQVQRLIAYYVRLVGANNPQKIAEFLGIHIAFMPLGNALGYYRYLKRIRWIFVDESVLDDRALLDVVIAHELGHAILHQKENCCFMANKTLLLTSRIERQANMFAAYLLITDDMLQDYIGCTKEQFCCCTGYPEELIEIRLNNFKNIKP